MHEHLMIIDGVVFYEKKGLTKEFDAEIGVVATFWVHFRAIGDRAHKIIVGRENTRIETTMENEELQSFNQEWIEKWSPPTFDDFNFLYDF
jgi:hypothetical protein